MSDKQTRIKVTLEKAEIEFEAEEISDFFSSLVDYFRSQGRFENKQEGECDTPTSETSTPPQK